MKGQTSLEFLVVTAVFLAVLFIWVSATISFGEQTTQSFSALRTAYLADLLQNTVDSVCLSGDGNSLTIKAVLFENVTVVFNKSLFVKGNKTFERKVLCASTSLNLSMGSNLITATNSKGLVGLSLS